MTFTVHGIDGFLFLLAALCFLVGSILAWLHAGHKAVTTLLLAGLFFWSLTNLVR
jgi:hypothetical protein